MPASLRSNKHDEALAAYSTVLSLARKWEGQWTRKILFSVSQSHTTEREWCGMRVSLSVVRRERSVVIDLHLLYVDRTDTVYQFIQRSLLRDPDHDQTIRRNPSILHA